MLPPKTLLVSWKPSVRAETYHIYWQNKKNNNDNNSVWSYKTQNSTSCKLHNANEIIVFGVNTYGSTQAAKLIFDSESVDWLPTF